MLEKKARQDVVCQRSGKISVNDCRICLSSDHACIVV